MRSLRKMPDTTCTTGSSSWQDGMMNDFESGVRLNSRQHDASCQMSTTIPWRLLHARWVSCLVGSIYDAQCTWMLSAEGRQINKEKKSPESSHRRHLLDCQSPSRILVLLFWKLACPNQHSAPKTPVPGAVTAGPAHQGDPGAVPPSPTTFCSMTTGVWYLMSTSGRRRKHSGFGIGF